MKRKELSKDKILRAYDLFMESAKSINEITETVSDQVRTAIGRVMGVTISCEGHSLLLDDYNVAVSTFGNIIDLYFIAPRSELRRWKPDEDLMPEEKKEDLRLMKAYLRGDIGASALYTALFSDFQDEMLRLRLEPEFAEVVDIYDTDRFGIEDEDDTIVIRYGTDGLLRIGKQGVGE